MIVFLNGPFGVGKSTTARILTTLLPHAVHYNPEHIGAGLRTALGPPNGRRTTRTCRVRWLVPLGARLYRFRYRTVVANDGLAPGLPDDSLRGSASR